MNSIKDMNKIKASEEWKRNARELWNKRNDMGGRRIIIRPALTAAVIACLLASAAAAAYIVSEYKNAIIVKNEAEMSSIAKELEAAGEDNSREDATYSVSAPSQDQLPLSEYLKSATAAADHWQEDTGLSWSPIGVEGQEWRIKSVDVSEGALWKRRAVSENGLLKTQYTGETLDALNDAEADTVKVVLRETDFTPIPYGNSLQIVRNKIGKLLGISYRACLVSEDDRYFQMEYSREAKAVDWGADFVLTDDYDEVVRFTAEDGREFIIKTFGDRLWAESVTAWETYYCYGIGMSIEDAENVLNNMWVTAAGAAAK